jgi:filamentous hemagglutinin family protein
MLGMSQSRGCWWTLKSLLAVGGAIAVSGNCAFAQIIPDNTLGAEHSVVTPNIDLNGQIRDRINGGATRGVNLFHSFSEFNVGDGQRVYFANPVGIENILTRVTGSNLSNILGTLGVEGGANLFLLNPNGIIFGPNARLDIAGSFFASTADSVVFNNGYQFSTKNPEAPPLLTISVPLGVQYGTKQSGTMIATQTASSITNTGNLAVGQDLTLAADNLDLQGQLQAGRNLTLQALDTVKVRDSAVNPFIASARGQLVVQGNQRVDIFTLNHPDSGFFSGGDMVLRSANTVGGDAHYWSGGSFRIEQLDSSLGNLSSPYDPIIRSLGDVSFNSYTGASLHILAAGQVNIGQVTITGSETGTVGTDYLIENVTLSDGRTVVPINGSVRPTLDVRAGVDPAAVGNPIPPVTGNNLLDVFNNIPIFGSPTITNTATSADIRINSITIERPNGLVFLTNQYKPNLALKGDIQVTNIRVDDNGGGLLGRFNGNGGNVFFDSKGNITIPSSGLINTSSATGDAGNVTLIGKESFSMTDGAQFNTSTYGRGNAGNVNINVGEAVSLRDSFIFSNLGAGAEANAGDINIQAGSLSLITSSNSPTNVAQLQALVSQSVDGRPAGRGNAGNISVDVRDTITISGRNTQGLPSGIFTDLGAEAVGNPGKIKLKAGAILMDSGMLSTITNGQGNAGNIEIEAGSLDLRNLAVLWASSLGQGNAGKISVQVDNSVSLSNSSYILSNVEPQGIGNAGDVDIKASTLSLTSGSGIFTASESNNLPTGKAGNIQINASNSVTLSGVDSDGRLSSGLYAGTYGSANAQAGNIEVTTDMLRVADGAVVNTSTSNASAGGTITFNANTLELTGGGQVLAVTYDSGKAGNINLNVANRVNISGSESNFFNRLIQFGGVVNEGPSSGLFAGGSLLGSTGDGGNISILGTRELNISDGGQISAITLDRGNAGNVSIKDTESINLIDKGLIITSSLGTGAAGNISIDTRSLNLRDESQILSGMAGSGAGENLIVIASDSVNLANRSQLSTDTLGSGSGGNLTVETRSLNIQNTSEISATTTDSGRGGNLRVQASDSVNLENQGVITTSSLGTGAAGNLNIETGKLNLQDASLITTGALSSGDGGNLTVKTTDSVNIVNNSKLSADTSGSGNAGNLTIDTSNLRIRDNSTVSALTTGSGRGGNLRVQASDSVNVDNQSWITTFSTDTGVAGNLAIETGKLSVRDGSLLTTSTLGSGNAGDLTVQAASSVEVANSSVLSSGTLGSGNGGDLTIETSQLSLLNTGVISTTTTSSGQGGNLKVQASDSVNLVNQGALITSSTDTGATGDLFVETGKLSIRDTSVISTTTFGSSDAGDLTVKAADSVEVVNGSRLLTDTRSSGNAGNLTVETGKFSIRNGSEVLASTAPQSSGRGGTVRVNASDSVDISGSSGLFTLTAGTGRAGDMTVETARLSAKDGGRVEAGTIGIAPGGNLTVNASESIELSGSSNGGVFRSGLSAYSLTAGNARSGNLTIATGKLSIRDGAEVTVTSLKGQAGNIDLTANSVSMNQGRITAETREGKGEGGANITLRLAEDLLMSNESRISATAFEAANGGNVTINARFIVAFPPKGPEGSDIIANAFLGDGGRVNITAQRLFNIDFRKRLTPLNDITASSEFGNPGVVAIETLGVDPARGLSKLPSEPGTPEPLEGCQPSGRRATSSFVSTGRGGLPPNPTEALNNNTVQVPWITLDSDTENSASPTNSPTSTNSKPGQLVEAQGWEKLPNGQIRLTATARNFSLPPCVYGSNQQ